jgi:hypothetical protein
MGCPEERARPGFTAWWLAAALVFGVLATLNSGGYRYGVGDQAFYLPAIERHLDTDSFPRDRSVLDDQDRLNVFTRVAAGVLRAVGLPLPALMAGVYALAATWLALAALSLGRAAGLSSLAQVAFLAALTLKHRVGLTGANTLEGYAHPRMLAFAMGLGAVVCVLRTRPWLAVAGVAIAGIVHPTTALWFAVWVGVALFVVEPRWRPGLAIGAAAAGAAALWAVAAGPLRAQAVVMDETWLRVLATKDYLFATDWPPSMWGVAALYVAGVFGFYALRRASGTAHPREAGLVAGLGALLALFLLTLPLVGTRVALAVQFQVSRVFWMFDAVATLYAVWALVYAGTRPPAGRRRAAAVALLLVLFSVGRGVFVWRVEHPGRPLIQTVLPETPWTGVMTWLRATPLTTHVLADPAHGWREGVSVRVGAGRDVYLEEVKDAAMAMYSRRVALRVAERTAALGDVNALTPASARALAARFGLDYLVTARPLDLPVAFRSGPYAVYRLKP